MDKKEVNWEVIQDFAAVEKSIETFLDSSFKTSFFIFPALATFEEYLDVGYWVEDLIESIGYGEVLKVVHFHPEHLFGGLEMNDAVNFSNRSPYPMLQLLRESDLEALEMTESWKQKILDRNATLLNDLGYKKMTNILDEYRK